jgi:acyl-CoA synthetase (AMP-forming)/AMP-acid ligase II
MQAGGRGEGGAGADPRAAPGSPERRAFETPHVVCLSDTAGRALGWRGLNTLADGLAARLHDEHGAEPGSRVTVLPQPGVELFAVLLALAKLGASALLSAEGAVDPARLPPRKGAPPRFTGSAPPPVAVAYTAGRTGRPRAVLRRIGPERAAAVAGTLADAVGRVGLGPGHAHLLAGPPERPGALFWAQLALALGGHVHVAAGAGPEATLRAIEAHAIESAFLLPADLEALGALPDAVKERHDTFTIDVVLAGEAPVTAAARAAAEDLFGPDLLRDVYATTETGPVAIDGVPLAGVEVAARAGELWVRTPLLADGYLDDPEATAAAFQDGWFATGDRGRVDARGHLALSG